MGILQSATQPCVTMALTHRRSTALDTKVSVDKLSSQVERHYFEITQKLQALEDGLCLLSLDQQSLLSRNGSCSGFGELRSTHRRSSGSGPSATQTPIMDDELHQDHEADRLGSSQQRGMSLPCGTDPRQSGIHITSQTVVEYEELPLVQNRATFTKVLEQSWVYQRNEASFRNSILSTSSSVADTGHWSVLSELSMAAVSNISVVNLPVNYQDIHKVFRRGAAARPSGSLLNRESFNLTDGGHCNACKRSQGDLVQFGGTVHTLQIDLDDAKYLGRRSSVASAMLPL